jgi:protein AroM
MASHLLQSGALDSLGDQDIAALAPREDEHVLVTRLRDGREVTIAKERILALMQTAVDTLASDGADVICVLCTGEFATLTSRAMLIYPDRILGGVVNAVLPTGTLGVLMPHPLQHDSMVAKWATEDRIVVTATASPYSGVDELTAAMSDLRARGSDLVVMDCMGFDRDMQRLAQNAIDAPVVLANGLTGSVLSELINHIGSRDNQLELA